MDPASISGTSFTISGPGGYSRCWNSFLQRIDCDIRTGGRFLSYAATYTGTITTGASSAGGTPMPANYVWAFSTAAPPPPPAVVATVPANGATNVAVSQALSATFSEAMSPASITSATFTVSGPDGIAVPGTVMYSGVTATFTPVADLAFGAVYTATITTGASSVAGIPLASNYSWTFTTITPPPVV